MIDLKLFKNIMAEARHNSDLLDSFSPNQFRTKEKLIEHIKKLNIIDKNSKVVIFGGWYGSILVPALKECKEITLIDKNDEVISVAKNRLFSHYDNVKFISGDVFKDFRDCFTDCDLFINTSCEHMRPMKEWGPIGPRSLYKDSPFGIPQTYQDPWWTRVSPSYFAFTSNNMINIEGHINCVSNIEEFKKQLPNNAKVLSEDEVTDERGTRFILVGKL